MMFSVEVQLIYNVVLVSGVQQSDQVSYIYICILFQIFAIVGCYKILNMVPCAIDPCHLSILYIQQYTSVYLKLLVYSSPLLASFCKGPDSKQFMLCKLPRLHRSYSSLLSYQERIHRQWQWVECVPIKVYFYLWLSFASLLVTQTVKNPPAMQETWYRSLGWEDPLEEGMVTYSSIPAWRITVDRGAWQATVHGVAKNQT